MENMTFWDKVQIKSDEECWLWTASVSSSGYGMFKRPAPGKLVTAHRHSFEIAHGAVPVGMLIMHSCDNKKCVNPKHLTLGTHLDNNRDCMSKGRDRKNSPKGERSRAAKLTQHDVQRIRRLYLDGEKLSDIAALFSINFRSITRICYGETWQHLLGIDGYPSLEELQAAKRRS